MNIRRMRRRLRKALSRGRQGAYYNKADGLPSSPRDLEPDPICKFFGATHVTDKCWFEFQDFAIAIEEAFGINISDAEAEQLFLSTIEEAIPWIRERMKNPKKIVSGMPLPIS